MDTYEVLVSVKVRAESQEEAWRIVDEVVGTGVDHEWVGYDIEILEIGEPMKIEAHQYVDIV